MALYEDKAISAITWMEVLIGTREETDQPTRDWLHSAFSLIPLDEAIINEAVVVRKRKSIKLPDAIIYATARISTRLLVTRNTRDFSPDDPLVRLPYTL